MALEELASWERERGWTLDADARERLETLVGLWLRYGAVMNLTGARTREELLPQVRDGLDTAWIVRSHVGDSGQMRWLDFGSGGGFPALVVAAVGSWSMMLMEPRQKRASFLELALGSIGRSSISVRKARFDRSTWDKEAANGFIEAVGPEKRVVSARAVWDPETWLSNGSHVVGTGGHVVLHLSASEPPEKFGAEAVASGERGSVAVVRAGLDAESR